jgi:hypothetical protein
MDNASPNLVMADYLGEIVPSFDGALSVVRCFDHIINLVAKTILGFFDTRKRCQGDTGDSANNENADNENIEDGDGDCDDDGEDDNEEGWVDKMEEMSAEEREKLKEAAKPVRKILVKVRCRDALLYLSSQMLLQLRKIASSTLHSTTKCLPTWFEIVKKLKLPKKTLLRDVQTQWNSTYIMLCVAYKYRKAIDGLTSVCEMEMWQYELSRADFEKVKELRDVLRVRSVYLSHLIC